ncbi:erythromycin esterase family protein [Phytomonospora endophytica]|uniref:Erythromycin esterase n=1 Tax=Phytomonospora endophytica TaxID=714109 RepID=A0A841FME5_9ACTN|nr:erythromycin esterase family protein [Phytomonospora endophytica]MBB6037306.1 erythromycin esterase [Phytomonospora endophytica]GIG69950.1 hypothetical protein Pen01_62450 [Phytomonospora endophytica]
MSDPRLDRRHLLGLAAAVAAASGAALIPSAASASGRDPIAAWLDRHAVPLSRLDAGGELDDLRALRGIVGAATIVGLGEPSHGGRELFTLRHRALRFLVERMGFRTIAFEETFGNGRVMDAYIAGGPGDARAIAAEAGAPWASESMASLLVWLRAFNRHLPDDERVRFLGTDLVQLRQLNFDELTAYVTEVAPDSLAELESHLGPAGMHGVGSGQVKWFLELPAEEKAAVLAHARAAHDLVMALPEQSTVDGHVARQHARVVQGFYEYYSTGDRAMRDTFMADSIDRWLGLTGGKAVYWGANVHTATFPEVTYTIPPRPTVSHAGTGAHLRARHGRGYVSIGVVFDHGELYVGWETGSPRPYAIPAPREGTTDEILSRATRPNYLVDLRSPASGPVAVWLDSPVEFRGVNSAYYPERDAEYTLKAARLSAGFEALMVICRTAAYVPAAS